MTESFKVPKRIPVDVMRKVLGDKRTEDFLTVAYGPKLVATTAVKIRKDVLERYLASLEGRTVEGAPNYQMIPAVFRLYYSENFQARGRFMTWLRRKIAEDSATEEQAEISGVQSSNGVEAAATQAAHDIKTGRTKRAKRREKVHASRR